MRRFTPPAGNDHERWMVSYADFVTLLFGFFVVMYSVSSVNEGKYRVLSDTLADAFAVDALSPDIIQVGEPTLTASPLVVDLPDSTAFADQHEGDTFIEDPMNLADSLLGGFVDAEGVSVDSNNEWLELTISAGLAFESGHAGLSETGRGLLDEALEIIQQTTNPITIEGYTDNIPSLGSRFPSNWELSGARASAVAEYLVNNGVRAERIAAVGYGENHPIATNATAQGRAENRRVVLVLARRADASRNLNANPGSAAFAIVRANSGSIEIKPQRTSQGGLLFTNEDIDKLPPPPS